MWGLSFRAALPRVQGVRYTAAILELWNSLVFTCVSLTMWCGKTWNLSVFQYPLCKMGIMMSFQYHREVGKIKNRSKHSLPCSSYSHWMLSMVRCQDPCNGLAAKLPEEKGWKRMKRVKGVKDDRRLDFEWRTHNRLYRCPIIKLYSSNFYHVINHCYPNPIY